MLVNWLFFCRYHHLTLPYQRPPWLMTSVDHDIVVRSTFNSLIRYMGHHHGCRMRSRECLPFRSTWSGFHRGSCCPVICVSLFHVI